MFRTGCAPFGRVLQVFACKVMRGCKELLGIGVVFLGKGVWFLV
ncbi:MAG: hypothetical protein M0Z31_10495 [Clostridia bacterium]|nr:hypothetical protein [Clostridia bacterium]